MKIIKLLIVIFIPLIYFNNEVMSQCSPIATSVGGGLYMVKFESSCNSWTVPAGVTMMNIYAIGGGGSGGSAYYNNAFGSGGGGGASAQYYNFSCFESGDSALKITVGKGGAKSGKGQSNGNDGGDSVVEANGVVVCKAVGGKKGIYSANTNTKQGGDGGKAADCIPSTNAHSGGKGGQGGQASGRGGGAGGGAAGINYDGYSVNPSLNNSWGGPGGYGVYVSGGNGANGASAGGYPGNDGDDYGGGGGAATASGTAGFDIAQSGKGGDGIVVIVYSTSVVREFIAVPADASTNYSGNWTVPSGVTSVTVECWGAGGAGGSVLGGSAHYHFSGGGGGGGSYKRQLNYDVSGQTSIAFTVGRGGNPNFNKPGSGASGGNTNFGTVFAYGGVGGENNKNGNGAGGAGSTNGSSYGGNGANGSKSNYGGGGGASGGYSANGGNGSGVNGASMPVTWGCGNGGNGVTNATKFWGDGGQLPGGGGGGGFKYASTSYQSPGGKGGDGLIVITYNVPPGGSTVPVSADAGTDQTVCFGTKLQLGGPGTQGTTYQWTSVQDPSLGTLDNPTIKDPNATPTVTTTYKLTAIGGSECPLSKSDEVTITVKALDPGEVIESQNICYGSVAQLKASENPSGTSSYSYQWEVSNNCDDNWSTIAGATSANYNTPGLTQDKCYRRLVTSECGSAYSTPILLENNLKLHYTFDIETTGANEPVKDYSGNNFYGKISSPSYPGWTANGFDGGAYIFNGATNSMIKGNVDLSSHNWTISTWVKKTAQYVDANYNMAFFGFEANGAPNNRPTLEIDRNNGKFIVYHNNSGGQTYLISTTTTNISKWYHVAITSSSTGGIKLYVNGVLEDQKPQTCINNGGNFEIGRFFNNNNYRAKGAVDDFRVYDKALNSVEVEKLYESYSIKVTVDEQLLAPTSITNPNTNSPDYCFGNNIDLTSNGGTPASDNTIDVWYAVNGPYTPLNNQCKNEAYVELFNKFEYTTPCYGNHNSTSQITKDGKMKAEVTGSDPFIWMFPLKGNATVDAATNKYVNVRYRVINHANTSGQPPRMSIFFSKKNCSTTTYPFLEGNTGVANQVSEQIIADNQWHIARFKMTNSANWNGTITGLRLDYFDDSGISAGSKIEIDFLVVSKDPIIHEGNHLVLDENDEFYPDANSSYTYYAKKIGCNVSTCVQDYATLPPRNNVLSNNEGTTCFVGINETVHFYNRSSGKLIASVTAGNQALGKVTASSYIDSYNGMTIYAYPILVDICEDPDVATAVLGRHWVITPTNNKPATVRLPYYKEEIDLISVEAVNTPDPADDVQGDQSLLNLSKYSGPNNVDGLWQNNCHIQQNGDYGWNINAVQYPDNFGAVNSYIAGFPSSGPGRGLYSEFTISSFSEFWLHGGDSPLPVELTYFNTSCQDDGVHINWETASENNSAYFVVEASRDGQTWTVVAEIPAAGYSTTAIFYSYIDKSGGLIYYRLRQVDMNGNSEVYGPISANCTSLDNSIAVYPNPTDGDFVVEITATDEDQTASIQLLDMQGRIIQDNPILILEGTNQYHFDTRNLAKATYTLKVLSKNNYKTIKVVKN